jgi:hypothetical protein
LGFLGLPWASLGVLGRPRVTLAWVTLGFLNNYTGCPINIVPLTEHLYHNVWVYSLLPFKVQKLANSTLSFALEHSNTQNIRAI